MRIFYSVIAAIVVAVASVRTASIVRHRPTVSAAVSAASPPGIVLEFPSLVDSVTRQKLSGYLSVQGAHGPVRQCIIKDGACNVFMPFSDFDSDLSGVVCVKRDTEQQNGCVIVAWNRVQIAAKKGRVIR